MKVSKKTWAKTLSEIVEELNQCFTYLETDVQVIVNSAQQEAPESSKQPIQDIKISIPVHFKRCTEVFSSLNTHFQQLSKKALERDSVNKVIKNIKTTFENARFINIDITSLDILERHETECTESRKALMALLKTFGEVSKPIKMMTSNDAPLYAKGL